MGKLKNLGGGGPFSVSITEFITDATCTGMGFRPVLVRGQQVEL